MGRRILTSVYALGLLVAVVSCSSETVVVDRMVVLKDGASNAFMVSAGLYRVEMTASGDGAQIEWLGGDCPKGAESKTYSGVCELHQDGQVVVSNPTSFGLGAGSTVTVKITKLGR